MKIAIVVSHPIQHFCPMYSSWAQNQSILLKVFFASNVGVKSYRDKNFDREIKWDNLYLEEFDHYFLNGDLPLDIDENLDAPSLDSELSHFKPDLLIQYGRMSLLNKRLRNWNRKNNVKLCYISDSENRHSQNIFKSIAKKLILPVYFREIDTFLTVGDANESYYRSYGVPNNKMLRMNFSIDTRKYDENYRIKEKLRIELREKLRISNDDLVLSVVGKLVFWKNQRDLLTLLIKLENEPKFPKFHLIIAGSGPCEQELRLRSQLLKSNMVHFLGFVDPIDLPAIYSATDIYIHPSSFEPHSLAISEAIYMGLPVIVSDKTGSYGPTDDVRIGENGFIFDCGNVKEMMNGVEKLLSQETREMFSEQSVVISRKAQQIAHNQILEKLLCRYGE